MTTSKDLTLEEKLNKVFNDLMKLKLSETEICILLANILIQIAKKDIATLDKLFIEDFELESEAFEDYNLLFKKLNVDQEAKSYLVASLGHQLIAIAHSLDIDKEKHYATTDNK